MYIHVLDASTFGLATISVLRPRTLTCHGRRGSSGQKYICRKVHGNVVLHAHGKRALTLRNRDKKDGFERGREMSQRNTNHIQRQHTFCNLKLCERRRDLCPEDADQISAAAPPNQHSAIGHRSSSDVAPAHFFCTQKQIY